MCRGCVVYMPMCWARKINILQFWLKKNHESNLRKSFAFCSEIFEIFYTEINRNHHFRSSHYSLGSETQLPCIKFTELRQDKNKYMQIEARCFTFPNSLSFGCSSLFLYEFRKKLFFNFIYIFLFEEIVSLAMIFFSGIFIGNIFFKRIKLN